MNIKRMKQLRNTLAKGKAFGGKLGFNMGTFIEADIDWVDQGREFLQTTEGCGTSGCIAGWACLLFGEDEDRISGDKAAQLLGLDLGQSERLFYNLDGYVAKDAWSLNGRFVDGTTRSLKNITVEEGVAALDRMIREEEERQHWLEWHNE